MDVSLQFHGATLNGRQWITRVGTKCRMTTMCSKVDPHDTSRGRLRNAQMDAFKAGVLAKSCHDDSTEDVVKGVIVNIGFDMG